MSARTHLKRKKDKDRNIIMEKKLRNKKDLKLKDKGLNS
jgi:hypothetical protein